MPAYDADFATPPAPVAHVTVHNPDTAKSVTDVPMLLDTGADVSLVPRVVLPPLGIEEEEVSASNVRLVGFDGSVSLAATVRLDLRVFAKTFRGEFVLTDSRYGVLGRDVLNHVRLIFDGPQLTWEENG